MKVIGIMNDKGGVGKTTLACHIAWYLGVEKGIKTLLIDNDPQGNATDFIMRDTEPLCNLVDVLTGKNNCVESAYWISWNLFLIATYGKRGMELRRYGETRIIEEPFIYQDLMTEIKQDEYEYVLIDFHPGLTILERSALIACDEVLVPMQPEYFDVSGLIRLESMILEINKKMRANVNLKTLVLNRMDNRCARSELYRAQLEELNIQLFEVNQSADIANGIIKGQTVFEYSKNSRSVEQLKKIGEWLCL